MLDWVVQKKLDIRYFTCLIALFVRRNSVNTSFPCLLKQIVIIREILILQRQDLYRMLDIFINWVILECQLTKFFQKDINRRAGFLFQPTQSLLKWLAGDSMAIPIELRYNELFSLALHLHGAKNINNMNSMHLNHFSYPSKLCES